MKISLFDKRPTQCQQLLEHFKVGGTVTSMEAYSKFGITQIATRITELEELGYEFERPRIKLPSGKRVCRYKLKEKQYVQP